MADTLKPATQTVKPPIHTAFEFEKNAVEFRRQLRAISKPGSHTRFDPQSQQLVPARTIDTVIDTHIRPRFGLENWSDPKLVEHLVTKYLLQCKHWIGPKDVDAIKAVVAKAGLIIGNPESERAHPMLMRVVNQVLHKQPTDTIRVLARPFVKEHFMANREQFNPLYHRKFCDEMAQVILRGDYIVPSPAPVMPVVPVEVPPVLVVQPPVVPTPPVAATPAPIIPPVLVVIPPTATGKSAVTWKTALAALAIFGAGYWLARRDNTPTGSGLYPPNRGVVTKNPLISFPSVWLFGQSNPPLPICGQRNDDGATDPNEQGRADTSGQDAQKGSDGLSTGTGAGGDSTGDNLAQQNNFPLLETDSSNQPCVKFVSSTEFNSKMNSMQNSLALGTAYEDGKEIYRLIKEIKNSVNLDELAEEGEDVLVKARDNIERYNNAQTQSDTIHQLMENVNTAREHKLTALNTTRTDSNALVQKPILSKQDQQTLLELPEDVNAQIAAINEDYRHVDNFKGELKKELEGLRANKFSIEQSINAAKTTRIDAINLEFDALNTLLGQAKQDADKAEGSRAEAQKSDAYAQEKLAASGNDPEIQKIADAVRAAYNDAETFATKARIKYQAIEDQIGKLPKKNTLASASYSEVLNLSKKLATEKTTITTTVGEVKADAAGAEAAMERAKNLANIFGRQLDPNLLETYHEAVKIQQAISALANSVPTTAPGQDTDPEVQAFMIKLTAAIANAAVVHDTRLKPNQDELLNRFVLVEKATNTLTGNPSWFDRFKGLFSGSETKDSAQLSTEIVSHHVSAHTAHHEIVLAKTELEKQRDALIALRNALYEIGLPNSADLLKDYQPAVDIHKEIKKAKVAVKPEELGDNVDPAFKAQAQNFADNVATIQQRADEIRTNLDSDSGLVNAVNNGLAEAARLSAKLQNSSEQDKPAIAAELREKIAAVKAASIEVTNDKAALASLKTKLAEVLTARRQSLVTQNAENIRKLEEQQRLAEQANNETTTYLAKGIKKDTEGKKKKWSHVTGVAQATDDILKFYGTVEASASGTATNLKSLNTAIASALTVQTNLENKDVPYTPDLEASLKTTSEQVAIALSLDKAVGETEPTTSQAKEEIAIAQTKLDRLITEYNSAQVANAALKANSTETSSSSWSTRTVVGIGSSIFGSLLVLALLSRIKKCCGGILCRKKEEEKKPTTPEAPGVGGAPLSPPAAPASSTTPAAGTGSSSTGLPLTSSVENHSSPSGNGSGSSLSPAPNPVPIVGIAQPQPMAGSSAVGGGTGGVTVPAASAAPATPPTSNYNASTAFGAVASAAGSFWDLMSGHRANQPRTSSTTSKVASPATAARAKVPATPPLAAAAGVSPGVGRGKLANTFSNVFGGNGRGRGRGGAGGNTGTNTSSSPALATNLFGGRGGGRGGRGGGSPGIGSGLSSASTASAVPGAAVSPSTGTATSTTPAPVVTTSATSNTPTASVPTSTLTVSELVAKHVAAAVAAATSPSAKSTLAAAAAAVDAGAVRPDQAQGEAAELARAAGILYKPTMIQQVMALTKKARAAGTMIPLDQLRQIVLELPQPAAAAQAGGNGAAAGAAALPALGPTTVPPAQPTESTSTSTATTSPAAAAAVVAMPVTAHPSAAAGATGNGGGAAAAAAVTTTTTPVPVASPEHMSDDPTPPPPSQPQPLSPPAASANGAAAGAQAGPTNNGGPDAVAMAADTTVPAAGATTTTSASPGSPAGAATVASTQATPDQVVQQIAQQPQTPAGP